MDKVLLTIFVLLSVGANAASIENRVFSLDAKKIEQDIGVITATDSVFLKIKSVNDTYKLASLSNVALSRMTQDIGVLHLELSGGWVIKGHIIAIVVEGDSAVIESDSLHLVSQQNKAM